MGTGASVTYSFMSAGIPTDATSTTDLDSLMGPGTFSLFKTIVESAFAAWSAVADLTFSEVPDDGAPFNTTLGSGDIRIGAHAFDGPGGTLAHGFFPPVNGAVSAAGDIHFDSAEIWKDGFVGPGFDVFQVMTHELGHALGLAHTAVPGSLMNEFYTEAFSGPQADDIAGMQFIYGAPTTTPIPVPAALPLMGSAFAVMGLFGWRRRRNAA